MRWVFSRVRRSALALCLAVVGLGTVGPAGSGGTAVAAVVSSIVVTGNERIEAETIRNYVLIVPGESFGAAEIDESVKALYGTGLFADVSIYASGNRLVVEVIENPIVNTVILRGNRKVKSNVLVQLIQTEARGVLTDARLQGDVLRIEDYYGTQGRGEATVTTEVTELPNNRVDVVFVIDEGERTGVGSITFVGNQAFSATRLRSVIVTRKHGLLSWLNRRDVFEEAKLAADQEALRRFYMSHGYADFRVVSVDWTYDEAAGRYHITYTLDEGPKYDFGSIDIDSSIPGVNSGSLMRFVKTRPGRTFDASEVEETVEELTIQMARLGYAFAQVRPRGDRDYENHTISITYLIDEGPRVYVERIDVYGNTKTRDYVIRREFDLAEGDAYNRVLIDRAERNLRNLGFFKTVTITTEPGTAPDRVIVVVQVEEESTGEFSVGAGWSTNGFIAEVSLNERNFLGRGQQLHIGVGLGEDVREYNISFTDPYFLGYNVSFGIDAFRLITSETSYRPYDSDVIGGGVRLGLPINNDLTFNLKYKISDQTISDTKKATSVYYPNGSTLTSLAGYSLDYSTIDNVLDPRSGVGISVGQEFAGLGGDVKFMRSTADVRAYTELFPDADIVGAVRVAGGNITGLDGEKVRILDNFFKGGETIRGFATYGYGPVDKRTDTPLGGKNYWAASAEVQFPFPGISPNFGLRGAVFADVGQLWDVDVPKGGGPIIDPDVIRSSVGGSILWSSPIGLLRGDFAYALSKAKTDETQIFRFSAGRQF